MKVLVTGANGFVGAALCRKLLERGDAVAALVRQSSDLSLLESVDVELFRGSLDDAASLEQALAGCGVVYHVAAAVSDWGTLEWFRSVNVAGTARLMKAAAGANVNRFVFVSTVAVHSFMDARQMHEESPQLATDFPYCQSKREAEFEVRRLAETLEMDAVIVRPGDVYGPGDRTSLLKMADMLERGQMLLVGGGETLGAFTYVENLADGIVLAGTRPEAPGEAFVITDGIEMSWKEYFIKLTDALDLPHPRWSVHPELVRTLAWIMETVHRTLRLKSRPPVTRYLAEHLCGDFHFSIEKARHLLGYEPAVGVDEAIRRTAEWYKSVRIIDNG